MERMWTWSASEFWAAVNNISWCTCAPCAHWNLQRRWTIQRQSLLRHKAFMVHMSMRIQPKKCNRIPLCLQAPRRNLGGSSQPLAHVMVQMWICQHDFMVHLRIWCRNMSWSGCQPGPLVNFERRWTTFHGTHVDRKHMGISSGDEQYKDKVCWHIKLSCCTCKSASSTKGATAFLSDSRLDAGSSEARCQKMQPPSSVPPRSTPETPRLDAKMCNRIPWCLQAQRRKLRGSFHGAPVDTGPRIHCRSLGRFHFFILTDIFLDAWRVRVHLCTCNVCEGASAFDCPARINYSWLALVSLSVLNNGTKLSKQLFRNSVSVPSRP